MARHGENIHKRKDGRWEGRYIKGRSETGKAIWGYVYAYSYVDAKSALIRKKVKAAAWGTRAYIFGSFGTMAFHAERLRGVFHSALSLFH